MPSYLISYKWKTTPDITHQEIKNAFIENGWNGTIKVNGNDIGLHNGIIKTTPNTTLCGDFKNSHEAFENIKKNILDLAIEKAKNKNHLGTAEGQTMITNQIITSQEKLFELLEDYIIVEIGTDNKIKT